MPTETNKPPTRKQLVAAVSKLPSHTTREGVVDAIISAGFPVSPEPKTLADAWAKRMFDDDGVHGFARLICYKGGGQTLGPTKIKCAVIVDLVAQWLAAFENEVRNSTLDEAIKIVFAEPINGDRIVQKIEALKTK